MAITGWGTANYLERSAAPPGTQPILISAWGSHKNTGTQGRAVDIGQVGINTHRRTLQIDATATPGVVQHSTSSVTGVATSTAAPAVDTWFQMSGWLLTNTSREITWDNANLGTNAVNKAPNTPDTTRIGIGCGGVGDWASTGGLAEISIWDAKLAAGDNPLAIDAEVGQVWTGMLLAYWPMLTHSDLADASGNGHDMTMVGTLTTFGSHPPVDSAPGGGTNRDGVASVTGDGVVATSDFKGGVGVASSTAAGNVDGVVVKGGLGLASVTIAGLVSAVAQKAANMAPVVTAHGLVTVVGSATSAGASAAAVTGGGLVAISGIKAISSSATGTATGRVSGVGSKQSSSVASSSAQGLISGTGVKQSQGVALLTAQGLVIVLGTSLQAKSGAASVAGAGATVTVAQKHAVAAAVADAIAQAQSSGNKQGAVVVFVDASHDVVVQWAKSVAQAVAVSAGGLVSVGSRVIIEIQDLRIFASVRGYTGARAMLGGKTSAARKDN
jgi:hypothetical protein